MSIRTLLGQVDSESLKVLPSRTRSPERVQQSIDAFALHLQGVSFRGIQEHFGWKAVSTAENAVKRGEELAKHLNLDSEKIRLKLAAYFDEILDITMQQVKEQVKQGRVTFDIDSDGNKSIRKTHGVDPRLLGEAGRGAIRFAQFVGLMDGDANAGGAGQVTMVNLSVPSDGANFADKWSGEAVDVIPKAEGDTASLPTDGSGQLPESPAAARVVDLQPADLAQNPAQNASNQGELF